MPNSLDHIVHVVSDLDAGEAFYRNAGFIVSSRNRHSWGTHNHIIQCDGSYIELLGIGEPEKIAEPRDGQFSFGAYNRDFVANGEGLSMLLLNSNDARGDHEAFAAGGISNSDVFAFSREGKRADGATVKLAFSLAFASDPLSPACGFAVCQHHYPENFWNASLQQHANGARRIAGVVFAADHPDEHAGFLKAFAGRSDAIDVLTPHGFREIYGVLPPQHGPGLSLAAIRLAGGSLDEASAMLKQNSIDAHRHGAALIVPPAAAHGATLIFEG